MSWTEYTAVNFGPSKTALSTVGYRLYDSSGAAIAARVTAGIAERALGVYAASIVFPDDFVGELRWDTGELDPLFASNFLNPRDGENLDARISTLLDSLPGLGAFLVTITVTDGTDPLQNVIVRLTEGINAFTARTDVDGIATFGLDAATYNVAMTKSGYDFTVDTIAVIGAANFDEVMTVFVTPPGPDTTLCRVFGSFETIDNRPIANVTVEFTLVSPDPTASERLITGRKARARTDFTGQLVNHEGDPWIELQRNDLLTPDDTVYRVNAPALQINNQEITLESDTFDLTTLAT